ncbi:hypothetical protein [Larkinella sp. C7]|uniref:hypothetical protein n=1 Tax=Larkinella sp. C7 TaxID=2576607 RepID=UPI0011114E4C|nr:hypothetical protein [Larkinella sp. C7]
MPPPAHPPLVSGWLLAKQYYDRLKAPRKAFILFEKSGHDPAWEEAQRFNSELVRIHKLVN